MSRRLDRRDRGLTIVRRPAPPSLSPRATAREPDSSHPGSASGTALHCPATKPRPRRSKYKHDYPLASATSPLRLDHRSKPAPSSQAPPRPFSPPLFAAASVVEDLLSSAPEDARRPRT